MKKLLLVVVVLMTVSCSMKRHDVMYACSCQQLAQVEKEANVFAEKFPLDIRFENYSNMKSSLIKSYCLQKNMTLMVNGISGETEIFNKSDTLTYFNFY